MSHEQQEAEAEHRAVESTPWVVARVAGRVPVPARTLATATSGVGAVAVLAAALWLRTPSELYLAAVFAATALGVAGAWAVGNRWARGAAGAFVLAVVAFLVPAGRAQWTARGLAARGATPAARGADAVAALARAVDREAGAARATARDALTAGATAFDRAKAPGAGNATLAANAAAFAAIRRFAVLPPMRHGERAVALFRHDTLVAWAGPWRVRPDSLAPSAAVGVVRTPFYLVLHAHAHARAGAWRAVATTLVHADPPGDTLAAPLDREVADAHGLPGFAVRRARGAAPGLDGWTRLALGDAGASHATPDAIEVRALVPGAAAVLQRAVDEGRRDAAPALLVMALVWVAAVWRRRQRRTRAAERRTELARRLLALLVPAAVVYVAPLNALSNASRAFDPAVYFSPVGGPFTGSVGALTLSGLLLVLGLFATLRAGVRVPSRVVSLLVVVALAGAAPFLLRALSRGITLPVGGPPVWLWAAWQVALFLVAAALLVAAAVAGRSVLGAARGLSPLVAPVLAGAAALAGPLWWNAPAGWPRWYPLLWVVAVAALALTRRSAALLAPAVAVAGLGSVTLVWSATARRRVEFAERDVRGLVAPDPEALRLLERLGGALADSAAAGAAVATGPDLLRAYAASPLAAAGYPVTLAVWSPDPAAFAAAAAIGTDPLMLPVARVATAQWRIDSAAVARAVGEARRTGAPLVRPVAADVGAATVYAAPLPSGRVLAVTLFPHTRLLPDDPVAALLGQPAALSGEPPYTLALVDRPVPGGRALGMPLGSSVGGTAGGVPSAVPPARWARAGDEIHGDWLLPLPGGPALAHAEVALRPLDVLAPRGALLTLLDLVLAGALWALPALADGALPAAQRRWRRAWLGSFRARITLALFAFFAVPTSAFAVWSYRELQAGDRQAREVLVRETLRAALTEGAALSTPPALAGAAARIGTPLLAYRAGVLVAASEPAVVDLAPFGRVLPPAAMLGLGDGNEVTGTDAPRVAGREALVGFRVALAPGGGRVVLAAPARADDLALDQRRRDLGFLVLLAVVGGGLAALWLSGLAARQLSRPVGALRHAALAVGGGGPAGAAAVADALDHALGGAPPAEFRPVFGAFRQMAEDLEVSRDALEAARRRTAAVLRDVASGVLAVDADARVTLANPRAQALLGRALRPGVTLDGHAPAPLTARVQAFVAQGNTRVPVSTGPTGDQAAFDVEVGGRQLRARLTRLMRAGGEVRGGAVLTLDDLTELARAQRVLAWGEMARQVAHEIKNPLTPIRLGVQLLRRAHRDARPDFGPMLENTVERVLAEIDRLDEIARSFSRYGAAPDRRAPAEPVDAAAVARDVVELERMGHGGVAWELEGAEAHAAAMARDGELREVLLNLLENARLAGARRVTVRLGGDAECVTLAVADDGEGIPAEVLPRIFEPHFSTRTSGSGLGLAISRRLVEAWGGAMRAESVHAGSPQASSPHAGSPPTGDASNGGAQDGAGTPSGTTITLSLRRAEPPTGR